MMLKPGTWLNHYEILGLIGTGGMGEVYRARDNKLNREVALKVLPEHFARDPERVARFRREAQLLAQLNHPNIALIYNFEEDGETRFLVMELALGDTLRERIHPSRDRKGAVVRDNAATAIPVPLEEALKIAKQIAEALEHAHEKPIIHRDLKPANIKVTPEGQVKVLDFGLAKAFAKAGEPVDPADIPTGSRHDTLKGTILGTPAYMSPEQASGKEVDKRADIWSFGCVLYELLTGKQAFAGETVTEILASVLKSEPDWSALPEATPPSVHALLRRCLQKEAKRRSRDATEIQLQIEETLTAPSSTMLVAGPTAPRRPVWRRALPWAAAAVLSVIVGIGVWQFRPETPTSRTVSSFVVSVPPADRILARTSPSVAISPNGTHLVYQGAGAGGQLYLRSLDSPDVTPIPGAQGGYNPFFSPDGQWIGFFSFTSGKLLKVPLSGGPATTLSDARFVGGATWGPDDTIVFSAANAEGIQSLLRVPAAGGTPTVLSQPDSAKGETDHAWPEFLPGGRALLFAIATNNNWNNTQIAALNLESGERRVLIEAGRYPRYAPTGHLVYYGAGAVMAVPFDPDRLEVTGAPAPVLEGVMPSVTLGPQPTGSGVAQFGFSQTGSLVYVPDARDERRLVWVDRNGAVQPLGTPPRAYLQPAISPDGRQVAVYIEGQPSDIWIYDIARGTMTRLTFEGDNRNPHWMPDGKRIAFTSERGGSRHLFWKLADGTGAEELVTNDKLFGNLSSISSDGKLAFVQLNPTGPGPNDIGTVELQGDREITVVVKTPFDEDSSKISPDGRWVAYLSNESGRREVYVRPFPGPGGRWQISTAGGVAPMWARNGRELFYGSRPGEQLMVVDITTQPTFRAGTPRVLLEEGFRLTSRAQGTNYDITPDGQRFLMVQGGDANLTQLNVVLNWFEELKRRVPAGR